MTEQCIWVTGYILPGRRELIVAQPPNAAPLMFSFDDQRIAYPVSEETLHSYRASGAVPTFYSMPNPF